MVQNSKALSGVKSIRAFLKENHPDNTNELGIDPATGWEIFQKRNGRLYCV